MADAYVGDTIHIHITWQSTSTYAHDFSVFGGIGHKGAGSPYGTLADEYANFTMQTYGKYDENAVTPGTSITTDIDITFTASDIGTNWDVVGLITEQGYVWSSIWVDKIYDMAYATDTVTVSPAVGATITSITFDIITS